MEQPGVVAGDFALSFSLNFFVHIFLCIGPIMPIWASLQRSFSPAEVEYGQCQFWSKMMTSEEEERPRFVTGGYGWHRHQWVKHGAILYNEAEVFSLSITNLNGRLMLPFDWLIHSSLILASCHRILFLCRFSAFEK